MLSGSEARTMNVNGNDVSVMVEYPKGEYDTIAGYVMSVLGRIPDADEHPMIEFEGFSFTVEEMDERRIVRILAERLPEHDEDDENAPETDD